MKPVACFAVVTASMVITIPVYAQVDCADWNTEAFFEAAEVSDVTRCLQAGSNPMARDEDGSTPLHGAASGGRAEAIDALLKAGANLEARTLNGSTPLHLAARTGRAEAINALLKAGTNLEAWTLNGSTPLHSAAAIGTAEAVTALLEVGANLEAQNFKGETPLHLALYFLELEEYMIESELEIERGNRTTNRVTRVKELVKTVTSLLKAGADPRAQTNDGKLPFDYVKDSERLKEAEYFTDVYWKLHEARFP